MTESHPAGKTESRVRLVEMGECETDEGQGYRQTDGSLMPLGRVHPDTDLGLTAGSEGSGPAAALRGGGDSGGRGPEAGVASNECRE